MQLNQFVSNTEFPPVPEAASWIAGRRFSEDKPLIDVSQAVPGYATASAILDHMATVLKERPTSAYGPVLGLPELREAYASTLANSSCNSVTAENIAITAGCNQAFYVAIASLCEPGDEVILPSPWYFNHKMSLDMLSVKAVPFPCLADDQLLPDDERAAALISKKTKAIVLISPNNPTGQIYPPATINSFYELCKSNGIALIIDETYRDFRDQPEAPPHRIFDDPDWPATAIHLYSFSKAYALAGYRVGALAASVAMNHQVTKVLDCVSICAAQISQRAALYGLQHVAAWKEEKRQLMYSRAESFQQAMADGNHGYEITALGPYFAYLRHPHEGIPARVVARQLATSANLLALPGEMFGPGQENFLRFAFANVDSDLMKTIAARLSDHLPGTSQ